MHNTSNASSSTLHYVVSHPHRPFPCTPEPEYSIWGTGNLVYTSSNPVTSLSFHESNVINTDYSNRNPIFESDSSGYNFQLVNLEAKTSFSSEDDNDSVISCDLLNGTNQTDVQDEINTFLQRICKDQYNEPPTPKRKNTQVEEETNAISSSKDDDSVTQKYGMNKFELFLSHTGDIRHYQGIDQNSEQFTRHVKKNVVCRNRARKICTRTVGTNKKRNGTVCAKNGAKVKHKLCNYEGCTNRVKSRGVCTRHGAKRPICQHNGCTTHAVKGGVCIRHGAKIKICMHVGCTAQARNGRVCARHGAKVTRKICSHDGCDNNARNGGVCTKHGAGLIRKRKANLVD
eukprot:CAMPEP_0196138264 /NCGR_PEP_ID=MMETSP0910-20130528/5965_1 /TAXON_ID=49265 /ORGANISM="Thalassiosira rotula, Strain GSO102" /LENGTH=343 /DNA_ID=CAMNT_0041398845 /DNA_START=83 /DNA_END=1114 /DNA_ORIENTATION=-